MSAFSLYVSWTTFTEIWPLEIKYDKMTIFKHIYRWIVNIDENFNDEVCDIDVI